TSPSTGAPPPRARPQLLWLPVPAAVLRLLAASRQPLVGVRFRRDIIGIIPAVGDQGLDILYIGAVSQKGHRRDLFLVVYIYFHYALFMAHIFFDPVLALLALH